MNTNNYTACFLNTQPNFMVHSLFLNFWGPGLQNKGICQVEPHEGNTAQIVLSTADILTTKSTIQPNAALQSSSKQQ